MPYDSALLIPVIDLHPVVLPPRAELYDPPMIVICVAVVRYNSRFSSALLTLACYEYIEQRPVKVACCKSSVVVLELVLYSMFERGWRFGMPTKQARCSNSKPCTLHTSYQYESQHLTDGRNSRRRARWRWIQPPSSRLLSQFLSCHGTAVFGPCLGCGLWLLLLHYSPSPVVTTVLCSVGPPTSAGKCYLPVQWVHNKRQPGGGLFPFPVP